MICKDILARLSDYIEQDIDPKICDHIDHHLESCPPCQAFIKRFRKTVELLHLRNKKNLKKNKKALALSKGSQSKLKHRN